MHDHVQEGTVIPAKPPSGRFILDLRKTTPAVLISNGVGITPMMAMAKAASQMQPDRILWFLHGARDGSSHAFRQEVHSIAQQTSNLMVHYRYSRPRPEDEGHYQDTGYVDAELIRQTVLPNLLQRTGATEAEYFLCGSPSFMQSLRDGLQMLGVPESQVFYESFTKAAKATPAGSAPTQLQGEGKTVVFSASDKTAVWQAGAGTLLEFAEANDLNPAFSCRQGICLTCMCKLQEGEVEYVTPPIGTPDDGSVLICISQPKTDRVVLEI
jgi:hypothetical protein